MKTKTYKSDILAAIHETVADLYGVGLVTKTTMRHFDESCLAPVEKLSPQQIKAIREKAHLSQPVFARHLNVSPVAVGQWERGERSPSGASLKLLWLVKKNGVECLV